MERRGFFKLLGLGTAAVATSSISKKVDAVDNVVENTWTVAGSGYISQDYPALACSGIVSRVPDGIVVLSTSERIKIGDIAYSYNGELTNNNKGVRIGNYISFPDDDGFVKVKLC
jgi:hypothetical protein